MSPRLILSIVDFFSAHHLMRLICLPVLVFFGLTSTVYGSGNLEFEYCRVGKDALQIDAECAYLNRPENPNDPSGKQIEFKVVKIPADTPFPEKDAFTVIQGGPGMSSIDLYFEMRSLLKPIRKNRDIVLIDQRGTGRTNMLTCSNLEEFPETDISDEMIEEFVTDCLSELEHDPRYYTTSIAVQDLEAVRKSAGYSQLSIYGTSYGTRVAQHFLRRYPGSVRVAILDGVAAIGVNLAGAEIAVRSQEALDKLDQRCLESPGCHAAFGSLKENFAIAQKTLREGPVDYDFRHPDTGEKMTELITEQHLLGVTRLMPYASESMALLPLMMSNAANGDFDLLATTATKIEEVFAENYAYAMNNAILCTEDAPFLTDEDMQGIEATYLGEIMGRSLKKICDLWPLGVVDDDFHEPLKTDVPVLILSGENDPITPVENGEMTHEMLSNSKHIVVPAHGHGVIGRGCVPQLASNFVASANFDEFDTSCIERELGAAFFVSVKGSTP